MHSWKKKGGGVRAHIKYTHSGGGGNGGGSGGGVVPAMVAVKAWSPGTYIATTLQLFLQPNQGVSMICQPGRFR